MAPFGRVARAATPAEAARFGSQKRISVFPFVPKLGSTAPFGVSRTTTIGRPFSFALEDPARIPPSFSIATDCATPPVSTTVRPPVPKLLSTCPVAVSRSTSTEPPPYPPATTSRPWESSAMPLAMNGPSASGNELRYTPAVPKPGSSFPLWSYFATSTCPAPFPLEGVACPATTVPPETAVAAYAIVSWPLIWSVAYPCPSPNDGSG